MRGCSRTSCAPTVSTIGEWPPTASCMAPSRSSHGPTRTSSGPGSASSNALRSALREYYPGALRRLQELGHPDALAVLAVAPDPERGRKLCRRPASSRPCDGVAGSATSSGGPERSGTALRAPQLAAPPLVAEAQAANTGALVAVISHARTSRSLRLEAELVAAFDRHPDAEILRSLPGLGDILGARVLAEFGDAPDRYVDARARRNYAGTAPITRASGTSRVVVARLARNKRLFDACLPVGLLCADPVTGRPRLLRRP